jgi:SAM-dependent methyltransferase
VAIDPAVRSQYRTAANLNARIDLHARFSANPYPWQRWIFDHLAAPKRARILELGCGPATLWTGNLDRIPEGWDITLSDLSLGMLNAATNTLGEAACSFAKTVADAQSIPFGDGRFQVVLANHMLYHVPDRARALREIARVLAPAGMLYATTVGEGHMSELWALLEPDVPDIHARTARLTQPFTLENGPEQLHSAFARVWRYDYDDGLVLTEAEPVIVYLRSSPSLTHLTTAQWDAIGARVTSAIARAGALHVRKVSGLLAATGAG